MLKISFANGFYLFVREARKIAVYAVIKNMESCVNSNI